MKIFDMHIHAENTEEKPADIIAKMEDAGIYGGCIISNRPERCSEGRGTSFEKRVNEALAWCRGYEDRLFPILWIDPFEENITENIKKAVEKGICGFKMICTDYYVYEDKVIEVLTEIAKLNKPVIFHSGILWNGNAASIYNRPLNWECLLSVKGLRFSMGHCSWPWTDECLSLFGEFMNNVKFGNSAEMFIDITPGAPNMYRKDLFEKFYTVGYDVGNNMMYGSDSTADTYSKDFVRHTIDYDLKVFDEIGLSKENREKLYYKNLLRFLGKEELVGEQLHPKANAINFWRCDNLEVYEIIEDFYKKLSFPKIYDIEFYAALKTVRISDAINIEEYDKSCQNGKRNLLSYLYMCNDLKKKYEEKNIPEEILWDTLSDLVIWTSTWSDIKGELYLGELGWLAVHLGMRLFKLGRLQFCMGKCEYDIPQKGLLKGDNVIEVHIPKGGTLDNAECKKSIAYAKEFFAKYFPEFDYKAFICHSWLMDDTLHELLSEDSNMIKFKDMFDIYCPEEDDAILRYVFKWNTTRYTVKNAVAESSFAKKVKEYVKKDKKFYISYGVLKDI